jgi:hypothetical protein
MFEMLSVFNNACEFVLFIVPNVKKTLHLVELIAIEAKVGTSHRTPPAGAAVPFLNETNQRHWRKNECPEAGQKTRKRCRRVFGLVVQREPYPTEQKFNPCSKWTNVALPPNGLPDLFARHKGAAMIQKKRQNPRRSSLDATRRAVLAEFKRLLVELEFSEANIGHSGNRREFRDDIQRNIRAGCSAARRQMTLGPSVTPNPGSSRNNTSILRNPADSFSTECPIATNLKRAGGKLPATKRWMV